MNYASEVQHVWVGIDVPRYVLGRLLHFTSCRMSTDPL